MAISDRDRKLLWGQSGFQCAICKVRLAEDATNLDEASLIGEECHIVAQSPEGPRGSHRDGVEIDSYENLILLCRNHHKTIDDQTNRFSVETLRLLKQAHEALVRASLPEGVIGAIQDELMEVVPDSRTKPVEDLQKDPFSGSSVILDTFPAEAFLHSQYDDESFGWRLSDAFPGRRRGLTVIDDPRAALDRLDVVLRHPIETLHHNEDGSTSAYHPFYWYRGITNMAVERYARLDEERCLIGDRQFLISRIAAYRDTSDPRQFIYIEARAEPPVGIYEYEQGHIEQRKSGWGYYEEAYALWNGRVLNANDYEDRATVIDGKPVAIRGAEFRTRFLTPYNMILATRHHVINVNKLDSVFGHLLNGILNGEASIEDISDLVDKFPLPPRMDPWY